MKGVLLLGHGSAREDANQMITRLAVCLRADLANEFIEPAFLQLANPDVNTGLARLIEKGCDDIFVLSLFLVSGNHHVRDSSAVIRRALEHYPGVRFAVSEPLLLNPGLYHLVMARLARALGADGDQSDVGVGIERESFHIVEALLADLALQFEEKEVVKRVVHATADPSFASSLVFHPQAVASAVAALRQGKNILADVHMVAVGLDQSRLKRLGGKVDCYVSKPGLAEKARQMGLTRTQTAMSLMLEKHPDGMVVIGNAPTALTAVLEAVSSGRAAPSVVIGVPVGYVGAAEVKRKLESSAVPYITNRGPRGGSPVVVAIVNALLRLAERPAG